MRTLAIILAGCLLAVITGCKSPGSKKSLLADQIVKLTQEKRELIRQVEQAELENQELKNRIKGFQSFGDDVKLGDIYELQSVNIGRYTGFYDKDKDGKKETLIVYIQPIDKDGDVVKAAGMVDVQLLDLNIKDGPTEIGRWQVKPTELGKSWYASLLIINYKLTFDVSDRINKLNEPLTINVAFTDYLSGKVFKEQKVIKSP